MSATSSLSRRTFLRHSALASAAVAFPAVLPARLFGQHAPSKQIAVGIIGVGGIAQIHIDTLLRFSEVRIIAVCDVDRTHRELAVQKINAYYENQDCAQHADFRELNRRPDLDAVWVCTPDHWHALPAIDAVRHGKDVYVEKPLTLTIREGRELVQAVQQHQRIAQVGTQQRSARNFHDVAEFIRNDGLGTLERIEVLIPANNKYCGATWQPEPVPAGLDWDFWLGPAPWSPYTRQGCHYNFRYNRNYAAGQVTNWGAHYIDIVQWALGMDRSGPVEVSGHGEYPTSGLFTTATKVDFTCRYANGRSFRCRTRYDGVYDGNLRFYGARGWLDISRNALRASDRNLLREVAARDKKIQLPSSANHHDNFLQCIRSRQQPISDIETGHRTTTACNIGELAMLLGRRLKWDPVKEEFVNDPVANRLRQRAMRAPWSLV
ncbi:MAG: Gfo/Idh/MocA family oxidoreductase [Opitutae bacterium]|nr:Gfo/Idh/MocA family oxidoreductase [Opitutae bacterium]